MSRAEAVADELIRLQRVGQAVLAATELAEFASWLTGRDEPERALGRDLYYHVRRVVEILDELGP